MKRGKRIRQLKELVERGKRYSIDEAIPLLLKTAKANFDETVDLACRLGVDPRKQDQQVRAAVLLPHGTGKAIRVLVFAQGEKLKEAEEAGADIVADKDFIPKIAGGFLDFDKAVATPDMMPHVGKLGKILGPRGLMPNPKVGTVTWDIAKTVKELKAGKLEFRTDKLGNVHLPAGKVSLGEAKLKENVLAAIHAIQRAKPSAAKGTYFRTIALSTSMGPSILLDPYPTVQRAREQAA